MDTSDMSVLDASIVSLNRSSTVPADMLSAWTAGGPAIPGCVSVLMT